MTDGIPAAPGTEGWFRDAAEGPHPPSTTAHPSRRTAPRFALVASRCTECGSLAFPPRRTGCPDPACDGLDSEPAELSTTGTLWSYTDSRYAPPLPYPRPADGREFEPYTLAAVELAAERMIVLGQVAPGFGTADLHVGMPMDLVPGTLENSEGVAERVWNWRPAAPAGDTR